MISPQSTLEGLVHSQHETGGCVGGEWSCRRLWSLGDRHAATPLAQRLSIESSFTANSYTATLTSKPLSQRSHALHGGAVCSASAVNEDGIHPAVIIVVTAKRTFGEERGGAFSKPFTGRCRSIISTAYLNLVTIGLCLSSGRGFPHSIGRVGRHRRDRGFSRRVGWAWTIAGDEGTQHDYKRGAR